MVRNVVGRNIGSSAELHFGVRRASVGVGSKMSSKNVTVFQNVTEKSDLSSQVHSSITVGN